MQKAKKFILRGLFITLIHMWTVAICQTPDAQETGCTPGMRFDGKKMVLSEGEWKERLTPEQFKVLRVGLTEPAFENAYFENEQTGVYECAGCSLPLFSSVTKYDSGTGWPSFWAPICKENLQIRSGWNPFSAKKKMLCSRCDGHIGEVFKDGPQPTGKRYCANSAALNFVEQ